MVIDPPPLPALVVGRVHHRRHAPFVHDVGMRTYQWLIDLDDVPHHWPLATFRRQDHMTGERTTWKADVLAAARADGGDSAPTDRVLALTGARCLGHGFDPLTVYWCVTDAGAVRWALLEVHNTYGGRHAQLLTPDGSGRDRVDKEFYVSPFLTVDGRYDVRLRLDPTQVGVDVNLDQDGGRMLSASFRGAPRPATRRNLLHAVARTPLVMHQTTARIRLHGIWLWLRRLPVVPRPARREEVPAP